MNRWFVWFVTTRTWKWFVIKTELNKIVCTWARQISLLGYVIATRSSTSRVRFSHAHRASEKRPPSASYFRRALVCRSYVRTCNFCVGYQRHESCKSDAPWDAQNPKLSSKRTILTIQNLAKIETFQFEYREWAAQSEMTIFCASCHTQKHSSVTQIFNNI